MRVDGKWQMRVNGKWQMRVDGKWQMRVDEKWQMRVDGKWQMRVDGKWQMRVDGKHVMNGFFFRLNDLRNDDQYLYLFSVGQTVQRKLMFLYKILSLSAGTTCKDIFVRRYLHFISPHINSVRIKGFVPDICRILTTYNLCHIIND